MKHRGTMLVSMLLCAAFIACACNAATTNKTADFSSAEAIIQTLCAKDMEGRTVGSRGGLRAAEYIAGAFEAAGLTPFAGESFLLEYTDQTGESADAEAKITLVAADGTETLLTEGVDYIYSLPYQDYDVQLPISTDALTCALGDAIYLPAEHVQVGSHTQKGLDYIAIADDADIAPRSGSTGLNRPKGLIISALSEAMRQGIRQEGAQLRIQMKAAVQMEGTAQNVAGYFPGENGNEALLVLAHYDGSGIYGDLLYPSAYDNASGTATMLRALALFAQQGIAPARDIIFLATDGEESSRDGAKAFTALLWERYKALNTINIDCIGHIERDFIDVYTEDTIAGTNPLAAALAAAGEEQGAREHVDGYSGDGALFMSQGQFLSATLSDIVDTASDRYHHPDDVPEQVDCARIEEAAALVAGYLAHAHAEPLFVYQPNEEATAAADAEQQAEMEQMRAAALAKYGVGEHEFVYIAEDSNGWGMLYYGQMASTVEELELAYPGVTIPREVCGYTLVSIELQEGWLTEGGIYTGLPTVRDGVNGVEVRDVFFAESELQSGVVYPLSVLAQKDALTYFAELNYDKNGSRLRLGISISPRTRGIEITPEQDAALVLGDESFADIAIVGGDGKYYNVDFYIQDKGAVYLSIIGGHTAEEMAELLREFDLRGLLESFINCTFGQ